MNDFTDVLETIAQNARRGHERAGDYHGEDGLLYCGRCRTRKEHRLELDTDPPKVVTVPVMCKCEEERQEAQRKEEERIKFRQDCERLRRDGITDPSYLVNTFAQDDNRNPAVSDVCRKYVDHWEEMKADNIGILFYCYDRGFFWEENGIRLYDVLDRVSCWCCANKNLKELRNIRTHLPKYWNRLKDLQSRTDRPMKGPGKSVFDLEERFGKEAAK